MNLRGQTREIYRAPADLTIHAEVRKWLEAPAEAVAPPKVPAVIAKPVPVPAD
jgi:hypothetical protein